MECRLLEIERIWAKDLQNMNAIFSKMSVYAEVFISSDPRSIDKTPVDRKGGENPEWRNYRMKFTIDESIARSNQMTLVFQLLARRVFGDRTVGFVYVPIMDLFGEDGMLGSRRQQVYHGENCGSCQDQVSRKSAACYQVTTPSGKAQGMLGFSYMLGEMFRGSDMYPTEHQQLLYPAPYQPNEHWYGFSHPLNPQGYHHHHYHQQYLPAYPPQGYSHALPYGHGGNHNAPGWSQNTSNVGNMMNKFGLGALFGMAAGCLEALVLCSVCRDDH